MGLLGERLESDRVSLVASGQDTYRVVRAADGEQLGLVELVVEGDVIFVQSLCIEQSHRGFGAGTGAAHLLRDAASASDEWSALRAWAPPDRGLAVYFWLRMGLRPVAGEGPEGGLLLERRLG